MMKLNKPLLSNILQYQFKLNSTQTKQAIRYFSTLNNNNNDNNNNQQSIKSTTSIINNSNNNINIYNSIRGISFFKIQPTTFTITNNYSIRQYSKKTQHEYSLEDEENKALQEKKENPGQEQEGFGGLDLEADIRKRKQTNLIYSVFSVLFVSVAGVALYNLIKDFNNSTTHPLGIPSYDAILLLQDIYFSELKPAMERGNPDFDALTKKNYFLDESGIRNHTSGDTTTLIVPIKQKKTRHDLGTINVDFVKEGKFITVENFYINAINGYHYPLESPENKIDSSIERYTGKYSLEELLTDPNLGYTTDY